MLNAVQIDRNRLAFAAGRALAADPGRLARLYHETPAPEDTLDQMIERRARFLTDYQDAAYAARYRGRLDRFRAALPAEAPDALLRAAARGLFKLMAYKDEFEVARLMSAPAFRDELAAQFEGDYRIHYHLAPPLWPSGKDGRGRPRKSAFGPWMGRAMAVLARGKGLRGHWLNPFGHHAEARLHRDLLVWFEVLLDQLPQVYGPNTADTGLALLETASQIRGYGPVRFAAADAARAEAQTLLARMAG